MKELLISLLESFGYPVFLQGTLSPDEPYPQSFFTFWNNSSLDAAHFDNNAVRFTWSFDVNFYSTDPALVNSALLEAKQLLKQNGFIISGKGYDLYSDQPTHTGRGMNALIMDRQINMEV